MRSRGPSLLSIIYVVIGIFVAIDNKYFENVDDIEAVISAVLAVLLWPLVLFDVNLMIGSK